MVRAASVEPGMRAKAPTLAKTAARLGFQVSLVATMLLFAS